MTDSYTPSMSTIRGVYVEPQTEIRPAMERAKVRAEREARFDRALEEHDTEVAARALVDAADEMEAEYEERTAKSGAYGQTKIRAALLMGAGMLRNRAKKMGSDK